MLLETLDAEELGGWHLQARLGTVGRRLIASRIDNVAFPSANAPGPYWWMEFRRRRLETGKPAQEFHPSPAGTRVARGGIAINKPPRRALSLASTAGDRPAS
jgi:hypothetical protein